MSRFYGDFDPASTASTTVVTLSTASRGIVEAVAQNFFPFESTAANLASGDGVFTSVGAFSYSSAVGTPYGAGTALRVEGGAHMTITSAGAVQMMEFSSAFTFEFWAYRSSGANDGYMQIIDSRSDGNNPNNCFLVYFYTGTGKLTVSPGASGAANQQIASTGGVLNAWQHYAIARDSSMSLRMFYDGVKRFDDTYTVVSDNKATGGEPHFFRNVNNASAFTGYIRDLRIFKDVCLYTTAFPVTTKPLSATSDNIGISTTTTIDTRTHSHVWNYTDVYDARFANTWPGNDPFASLVTTTGATAVEPGNGFRYLIFTTSGSLTVPSDAAGVSVEYLVVGGGGGGTANRGAGAGAGGLRTNVPGNPLAGTSMTLPAATYPVVVGAGGTSTTGAFPFDSGTRTAGTASSFNNIESAGGGRGAAGSGGSGAGGHTTPDPSASQNAGSGNVPPVTPPQGNDGGVGGAYNSGRGGGGGGAGSAGTPGGPAGGGPGAGGNGHPIPAFASPLIAPGIPSDAATAIGPTGLFAGGGGGGGSSNGLIPGGAAGPGGGGAGGRASINPGSSNPSSGEDGPAGAPGVDNTGGGGGGAGNYSGNNPAMRPGGVGGKGVVILRFPTTEK